MKVCIKNYFRNAMVNLTARSILHFIPGCEIYCLNLFKDTERDYDNQSKLIIDQNNIFFRRTKHILEGGAFGNAMNGPIFAEGYNYIFDYFKNLDDKLLILAEDHFFTTGKTLKELQEKDWRLAYASWGMASWGQAMNGSLLGVVPTKIKEFFPIDENRVYSVEGLFHDQFLTQEHEGFYKLSTRNITDYCGDGCYTNDINKIILEMHYANII